MTLTTKVTCSAASDAKYLVTGGTPMGKAIPVHEKHLCCILAAHSKQVCSKNIVSFANSQTPVPTPPLSSSSIVSIEWSNRLFNVTWFSAVARSRHGHPQIAALVRYT